MQCHEAEPLLIDYLDGELNAQLQAAVKKHLEICANCKKDVEEYQLLFLAIEENKLEKPGPGLREKFESMLQSELNIHATSAILKAPGQRKLVTNNKTRYLLRVAASIILVAGGILIGTKIKPGATPKATNEMAELKTEIREMKEVMMLNLLEDESASERIKAVSFAEDMENPDHNILEALIHTMNQDKNVNVRLAALYSVAKFSGAQIVRDSMVASLSKQTEPIMQIVLINLLTEKKERRAIGPIREILKNKKTLKPVKDIAEKGLLTL
jgi:Putative zinc-finger